MELWQLGAAQMGTPSPGKQNVAEINAASQGFATRIGQERNRVAAFFLGICEVLSGLMVLYSDFPILSAQEKQAMETAWDAKHILHDLVLNILPDSTIVLDTQARIGKLTQFLNITAKSGYVNPMPIIAELAELSGLDPAEVLVQPQPKPPDEPNLSLRLSGKDDLMNPMALAMYFNRGAKPSPQQLEEAKQMLQAAQQPAQPPAGHAPGGAPVAGPPASAHPGVGGPSATPPVPTSGQPPAPQGPPAQAHEDWTLNDKILKRSRDSVAGA